MAHQDQHAAQSVTRFNAVYSRRIAAQDGAEREEWPFSATQERLLRALAERPERSAHELIRELDLDTGYTSRLLADLERRGLISRERSTADARQRTIRLSAAGTELIGKMERAALAAAESMLAALDSEQQVRLLEAMHTIEHVLESGNARQPLFLLRRHRSGDSGWVLWRHAELYSREFGLDERFEAAVAELLTHFIRKHNPGREALWIAELDGRRVGSVMLVDAGRRSAQVRLLLVEPAARGRGLGLRLLQECIAFARQSGYEQLQVQAATGPADTGALYTRAGLQRIGSTPHPGHKVLRGETWAIRF